MIFPDERIEKTSNLETKLDHCVVDGSLEPGGEENTHSVREVIQMYSPEAKIMEQILRICNG